MTITREAKTYAMRNSPHLENLRQHNSVPRIRALAPKKKMAKATTAKRDFGNIKHPCLLRGSWNKTKKNAERIEDGILKAKDFFEPEDVLLRKWLAERMTIEPR